LGIEPELTTVTKLPRRIFTFSYDQYSESVRMLGVHKTFLNFANYLPNKISVVRFSNLLDSLSNAHVSYIGVGPTVNDVLNKEQFAANEFKTSLGI